MTDYQRPEQRLLPSPTTVSQPFWTGGHDGQLLIYQCASCRRYFHPPAPACWRCRSRDVAPQPVTGRGKVAAFTINQQLWIPGLPPPYVVAIIELDDEPDVRLTSNVVDIAATDVEVGLPVTVFFENWDDVWIPLFRRAEASR
ncbi:hypothetical protein GGC64_006152 [Mycobacterium sp. OAS707]|nr:hypothetical protein [Mycobacterium sp. OAS707]